MILTLAIDETGGFQGQKLGGGRERSGVAIIGTHVDSESLKSRLQVIRRNHGLADDIPFHAAEFCGRRLSQLIPTVSSDLRESELFRCGVYGKGVRGRLYFNEQQAYGEMLLAALSLVPKQFPQHLATADSITIIIATRSQLELMGYMTNEQGVEIRDRGQVASIYAEKLCSFIKEMLPRLGWERSATVLARSATYNPFLALADFACWHMDPHESWIVPIEEVPLPTVEREVQGFLQAADPVAFALHLFRRDGHLPGGWFKELPAATADTVLLGLLQAAQALVSDRHGKGSLDAAGLLAEALWPLALAKQAGTILSLLCAIGLEVVSHQGNSEQSPTARLWVDRRDALPPRAWGRSSAERTANRLELSCQVVQVNLFNIFAFEEALELFTDIEDKYRKDNEGDGQAERDVIYGKILGTLGQAMGFLKPQVPSFIEEVLPILERSRPCFEGMGSAAQILNQGLRLTELWDNEDADTLERTMEKEHLPAPSEAQAYDLLHRFRALALRKKLRDLAPERVKPLVDRLLVLCQATGAMGQTPFDLCLKWSLFLDPSNLALTNAAMEWLACLDRSHITLRATSLPLAVMLGQGEEAQAALSALLALPGFDRHWRTSRAAALRDAMDEGGGSMNLGYEALRAMPWNYS